MDSFNAITVAIFLPFIFAGLIPIMEKILKQRVGLVCSSHSPLHHSY